MPSKFRRRRSGATGALLEAAEFLLFAGGLVALVLFAWWQVDSRYHQAKYQRELEEVFASLDASTAEQSREPAARTILSETEREGPFGRLLCPRIGLDVAVLNGLDDTTLRRAAGRLPRNRENLVIAAHRDTFFRPLKGIREGDRITLENIKGETQVYKVRAVEIVDPSAVHWMHETESPALTLITCYPFDWIGRAPRRFVVRAVAS